MPQPSNPTPSRARTSPPFTGRRRRKRRGLRLQKRKRRLPANINSPDARKSENNTSPTQTKTSDGRSMRIGISAPTLVPTVSTKNGQHSERHNRDDLAMSEVNPLPNSDT